jgi:predicted PhzF superfamily epimerase YddE/YHI9
MQKVYHKNKHYIIFLPIKVICKSPSYIDCGVVFMDNLPDSIDNWSIKYFSVLPVHLEQESQAINEVNDNVVALIYDETEPSDLSKIKTISYELNNTVLIYAHPDPTYSSLYKLHCFYNGQKLNIVSYALFSLIGFLYDRSVLSHSIRFALDGNEIEVSTYPDRNSNFAIMVNPPQITELDVPLYEVLESISLDGDLLNTDHKICILENDFDRFILIPVLLQEHLKKIDFKVDKIVYNSQKYGRKRVFPSFLVYSVSKDGRRIDSRFINTSGKIFECSASPMEASMLHYYLHSVEKQLPSDGIHHYQGNYINRPTHFITSPSKDYADVWTANGKCVPLN